MFALCSIFCFALVLAVNAQETCTQYGGVCIVADYCDQSLVIRGGLCSDVSQTCCLGENCPNLGGECIDYCPSTILGIGARAVDCPTGTRCCVWL